MIILFGIFLLGNHGASKSNPGDAGCAGAS